MQSSFQDLILVKKFGGTSVGTIERIERVADKAVQAFQAGKKPVIVVSAMAGETNRLVGLASQLDSQNRGPAYDMLLASGEQVSVALVAIAIEKRGVSARPFLAYQLGIETDNLYSKARILNIRTQLLLASLDQNQIPVIAGFQGVDQNLNITTLGRGGSDTTAVAVAAALKAKACDIYTDVPAVFTADPRLVPKAREIQKLSFEEMMEMASLGSKVLHIRSVEIGAKYGIRIQVRSSFEDREGTWIVPEGEIMEQPVVSSVTHDANTLIFELAGVPVGSEFLANLFAKLATRGVSIDIISQSLSSGSDSKQRVAFSITQEDLALTEKVLSETLGSTGIEVKNTPGLAKVSIVGVGMRNHPGVAARFFKVLADRGISVFLVTTSEIKISAVIEASRMQEACQSLHSEFGLDVA